MFLCVFCFFSFIWIFCPVSIFCYTSVSCLYLGLLSVLVLSFVLIHFKCLIDPSFCVSLCVCSYVSGWHSISSQYFESLLLIFLSYEEGCFKRATRKTKTREIKVKERNKNGTWIKKTNHWKRIIGTEAKTNWKGNETAPQRRRRHKIPRKSPTPLPLPWPVLFMPLVKQDLELTNQCPGESNPSEGCDRWWGRMTWQPLIPSRY